MIHRIAMRLGMAAVALAASIPLAQANEPRVFGSWLVGGGSQAECTLIAIVSVQPQTRRADRSVTIGTVDGQPVLLLKSAAEGVDMIQQVGAIVLRMNGQSHSVRLEPRSSPNFVAGALPLPLREFAGHLRSGRAASLLVPGSEWVFPSAGWQQAIDSYVGCLNGRG